MKLLVGPRGEMADPSQTGNRGGEVGQRPTLRPLTDEEKALLAEIETLRRADLIALLLPAERRPKAGEKMPVRTMVDRVSTELRRGTIEAEHVRALLPRLKLAARIQVTSKLETLQAFLAEIGEEVHGNESIDALRDKASLRILDANAAVESLEKALTSSQKATQKRTQDDISRLAREVTLLREENARTRQAVDRLLAASEQTERSMRELVAAATTLRQASRQDARDRADALRPEELSGALQAVRRWGTADMPLTVESLEQLLREAVPGEDGQAMAAKTDSLAAVLSLAWLARNTNWPLDLFLFYDVLADEVRRQKSPMDAEIPTLRQAVRSRLHLTDSQFDAYVLDCRQKGWVSLKAGAPIGQDTTGSIDVGGHRFYYLALARK